MTNPCATRCNRLCLKLHWWRGGRSRKHLVEKIEFDVKLSPRVHKSPHSRHKNRSCQPGQNELSITCLILYRPNLLLVVYGLIANFLQLLAVYIGSASISINSSPPWPVY